MRIGFRGRGSAKGITLRNSAGFSIAAFLFLDLGEKQTQTTLLDPLTLGDLDLMTGFTRQTGVQCDPRQQKPALGMCWITRDQTPGCLNTGQLIGLNGQGEVREIGVRRVFPGIRNA
jgi:hypothetical protein